MNKQPSLIKILTIDYAAFLAVLFPIIMWGLYIVLVILEEVKLTDLVLPVTFALITVVSIGVIGWRVRTINTVFSDGMEATAAISNVSFFRDRGRVDYVYTYQGQKYVSGNAIHKVKQTLALRVGAQVVLMVDRNNPRQAFIRDLYM